MEVKGITAITQIETPIPREKEQSRAKNRKEKDLQGLKVLKGKVLTGLLIRAKGRTMVKDRKEKDLQGLKVLRGRVPRDRTPLIARDKTIRTVKIAPTTIIVLRDNMALRDRAVVQDLRVKERARVIRAIHQDLKARETVRVTREIHRDLRVKEPVTREIHRDLRVKEPATKEIHRDLRVKEPVTRVIHQDLKVREPARDTRAIHQDLKAREPARDTREAATVPMVTIARDSITEVIMAIIRDNITEIVTEQEARGSITEIVTEQEARDSIIEATTVTIKDNITEAMIPRTDQQEMVREGLMQAEPDRQEEAAASVRDSMAAILQTVVAAVKDLAV